MRHLGATSHRVGVGGGLYERVQATVPKIVAIAITLKDKLIAHIVARASTRAGVGAELLLQFGIEFLDLKSAAKI